MRILELFSGTGSVGKAANTLGYKEVISIDIDDKFHKPTHLCDIMSWDYTVYPKGYFDVVWASPPCTFYSSARRVADRNKTKEEKDENLENSDKIVRKTLEIIDYFSPKYWFLENPQSGELKNRPFMKDLPYIDADYCKYGYSYRKRTRFWTNSTNKTMDLCKYDCPFSVIGDGKNRHIHAMSCSKSEGFRKYIPLKTTLGERYSIPQPLLLKLLPKPKIKILIKKLG